MEGWAVTLNDRFTKGFLAGLIAGIPALAWGLLSRYVLHFTTLLYKDFAAILTYGNPARGILANLFAQAVVFFFFGFNGVLFSYLTRIISTKNLVLKGGLWGSAIWFASYTITLFFKVPGLLHIPPKTSISQLVGGLIWGVALAVVLKYLDRVTQSS